VEREGIHPQRRESAPQAAPDAARLEGVQRLKRARAIFAVACDYPADERPAFVQDSCGDDVLLRELVTNLLAADADSDEAWETRHGESLSADGAPAPLTTLPPGYTLIRELGRGGVGVVFLCWEDSTGNRVAVKVIDTRSAGRSATRRFNRECKLLSTLRHRSLVGLRSRGTLENGCAYLVMDFVDGTDIRRHCRESRVPAWRRMQLMAEVADAVAVAHARNVVHRDLKPANILVDRSGCAKVIDFGAARVSEGTMQSRHEHTLTGQIVGTLSYLSPEQASGQSRRADHRSDLYQLAVVAFELLANRMPFDFDGQTSAEKLRTIIAEPAIELESTGAVEPGHPACAVFKKALSKDPADRFQSADEMAAAFRSLEGAMRPGRRCRA
jgi:serine/threonine protein kinase